jgi:hypothetical protein
MPRRDSGMPRVHGGLTGNEILPTETNRHDARSFSCLTAVRSTGHSHHRHIRVSIGRKITRAFSSEVDAGSRKENASKQQSGASVLIQSEPIML